MLSTEYSKTTTEMKLILKRTNLKTAWTKLLLLRPETDINLILRPKTENKFILRPISIRDTWDPLSKIVSQQGLKVIIYPQFQIPLHIYPYQKTQIHV